MADTELKKARLRAGLTQVQLSELSGVTQSSISRLEAGYVGDPSYRLLEKLAAALRTRRGLSSVTAATLAPPDRSNTAQV